MDYLCDHALHERGGEILNAIGGYTGSCADYASESISDQISGHSPHLLLLGCLNGRIYFYLDQ